ncbi:purine-binding chemotaxis protein CheW [Aquitalea palustris]|uniref:Purine-binding chemotaxis protein CheW n=1 Tax=Aquitalea palustris TaxID=2480983 RepID=A0A454JDF0_9NEIS|nr:chemotaxis protein CheW [Aquitalea palustris]RMC91540.1 purine-binding chemotaxis protein CheW [Aquitalea palustris]
MGAQQHWRKAKQAAVAPPPPPSLLQYLRLRAGPHQLGLPIEVVRELLEYQPLTTLPNMPPPLCGMLNLRGSGVPVIELAQCLGLPAAAPQRRSCIIILQLADSQPSREIGILVDEVYAVLELARSEIEDAPQLGGLLPEHFIAGLLREAQGFTVLLDAKRLLSLDELARLAPAAVPSAQPDLLLQEDAHD